MTAGVIPFLKGRFPGQDLSPDRDLCGPDGLPGFGLDDRAGLALEILNATDGRVNPTDAQAQAWITIGDVLACESSGALCKS